MDNDTAQGELQDVVKQLDGFAANVEATREGVKRHTSRPRARSTDFSSSI
jgi:hypothetical protein